MYKNIYLYSGIISLFVCIICTFFCLPLAFGVLIGVLGSYLYFYLLTSQFKFEEGKISKGGVLGFGLRIIVLAMPLLIACLLPQYFNIFGAFGGVMIFRIIMMIMFYKQKGEM